MFIAKSCAIAGTPIIIPFDKNTAKNEVKNENAVQYDESRKNKAQDRKRRAKLMNTEKEIDALQGEIDELKQQEIDEITNQIETMQNIGFESEKEIERIKLKRIKPTYTIEEQKLITIHNADQSFLKIKS